MDTAAPIHFSAQVISRSSGRSATAAAAYRSGSRIADERTGEVHDYTRKGGVVFSEILLPEHAPQHLADRSTLWNAVEAAEKSKNAQLCREINFALPRELTQHQNIALAHRYIQETFVDAGMIADWSYHDPDEKNDNPHVHVMLTMREVLEDGTFAPKARKEYLCRFPITGEERYMTAAELKGEKDEGWEKVYTYRKGNERRKLTPSEAESWEGCKRQGKDALDRKVDANDWNDQGNVEKWRAAYAQIQNYYLRLFNKEKRVDHRSFERRGIDQIPQVHLGAQAHGMEQKGERTDLGDKNRAIGTLNQKLNEDIPQEVKQEILEEGYAIKDMPIEYRGQVEDRAQSFLARIADRLRELARDVHRTAQEAAHALIERARAMQHREPTRQHETPQQDARTPQQERETERAFSDWVSSLRSYDEAETKLYRAEEALADSGLNRWVIKDAWDEYQRAHWARDSYAKLKPSPLKIREYGKWSAEMKEREAAVEKIDGIMQDYGGVDAFHEVAARCNALNAGVAEAKRGLQQASEKLERAERSFGITAAYSRYTADDLRAMKNRLNLAGDGLVERSFSKVEKHRADTVRYEQKQQREREQQPYRERQRNKGRSR